MSWEINSVLSEVLIEGMIDEAFDELNTAHKECELSWYYSLLMGINDSDESYL